MKKLVFEKREVQPLTEFLQKLELKNRVSRLRNKLVRKLAAILAELEEDRLELLKEHSCKDEEGQPVIRDDQYKIKDWGAFGAAWEELFSEEVAIETGEYSSNFAPLFAYLDSEDFDMPLQGADADCYDRLLTLWEEAQEENEEE